MTSLNKFHEVLKNRVFDLCTQLEAERNETYRHFLTAKISEVEYMLSVYEILFKQETEAINA